jgi:hypothetical protein
MDDCCVRRGLAEEVHPSFLPEAADYAFGESVLQAQGFAIALR